MSDVLVVMARYPEVGRVKTRLAGAVGAEAACELHRAFLRDLYAVFDRRPYALAWAVTPAGARLDGVVGAPLERCIDQRGDGLAERMRNCFADLFAAGAARVAMIGADVPHIDPAEVERAFAALEECDVVLAPSRDGGYGLVALRRPVDVFTGVEMGSDRVLDQTRRLCAERELSLRELSTCFDVDQLGDVRRLDALLAGSGRLPATRAVIESWRERGLLQG